MKQICEHSSCLSVDSLEVCPENQVTELDDIRDYFNANNCNNVSLTLNATENTPSSLYSMCLLSMQSLFNDHLNMFIKSLDEIDTVMNLSDFELAPHHVSIQPYLALLGWGKM